MINATARILSIVCLLLLLAACGQKGPLILPEDATHTGTH